MPWSAVGPCGELHCCPCTAPWFDCVCVRAVEGLQMEVCVGGRVVMTVGVHSWLGVGSRGINGSWCGCACGCVAANGCVCVDGCGWVWAHWEITRLPIIPHPVQAHSAYPPCTPDLHTLPAGQHAWGGPRDPGAAQDGSRGNEEHGTGGHGVLRSIGGVYERARQQHWQQQCQPRNRRGSAGERWSCRELTCSNQGGFSRRVSPLRGPGAVWWRGAVRFWVPELGQHG